MLNLMKAVFYRIKRTKVVYILFSIMCICAIAATGFSYAVEHASISKKLMQQASGFADMLTMVVIGPFFAGIVICSDFQTKTIHDSILYAKQGRRAVIFSKLLTNMVMVMFFLLPYAICTIVGFLSGAKFSLVYSRSVDSVFYTLLANETNVSVNANNILKLLVIIFVIMLVYAARMSLNILLIYCIRKPVVVVGVGIAIQMILSLLGPLTASSELANQIFGWPPFASFGSILTFDVPWDKLASIAGVSLAFMGMINGITGGIFQKSDIK